MKLLRTIRFDQSDTFAFDIAAEENEWAVSGAFAFSMLQADALSGKTRQAFANGFLGTTTWGRATFTVVASAPEQALDEIVQRLKDLFLADYGAPGEAEALAAANEEANFVKDLCVDAPINTVFTVHRSLDETGNIAEAFRRIQPPTDSPMHSRIWAIEDD